MAATLVTRIGLPRSGMYKNVLGALEIIGRKLGYGLDTAVSGASNLFFNNEQGVWYDPSDFSTLFQDSAGTTPVTAVEQPVGLILDKSKGLVRGADKIVNGGFDSSLSGWSQNVPDAWSWVSGRAYLPLSSTYQELTEIFTAIPAGSAAEIIINAEVVSGSGQWFYVNAASTTKAVLFTSGTNTTRFIATDGISKIGFCRASSGGEIYIDNISVRELPGNHATQATAASRPVLKQDANGKYYLFFDGVDDSLATGSIDFTSTDKMTVFAGVRKLSDGPGKCLLELSVSIDSNVGAFDIRVPAAGSQANYLLRSKGTVSSSATTPATYPAPYTAVLAHSAGIGTDTNVVRVNGAQVVNSVSDQGTGNYGNYPLYIGRRGGTTLPFNGHLYSLIVRGAQSTDSQIVNAENYVNSKTGAY